MRHAESGRPDLGPLLFGVLIFLAALTLSNGVWMILFPHNWYLCLITPERAALFNPHLVIDVGGAYVTSGVALFWAALRPRDAFPLLAMSLLFALLHGGNHLYEYATFGVPTRHPIIEWGGIWAPVAILVWLTLAVRPGARRPR